MSLVERLQLQQKIEELESELKLLKAGQRKRGDNLIVHISSCPYIYGKRTLLDEIVAKNTSITFLYGTDAWGDYIGIEKNLTLVFDILDKAGYKFERQIPRAHPPQFGELYTR